MSSRRVLIVAHDLVHDRGRHCRRASISGSRQRALSRAAPLAADRSCPAFSSMPARLFAFQLYAAKWRFASLPDLMNIFRAVDGAGACRCWCSITCWSRPTSTARSSSARSPSCSTGCCRCFSSGGRVSPIAISAIPARSTTSALDASDSDTRRSAARPTPRFCCAPSRAARSTKCGRSASCRRRAPTRARRIRGVPVLGDLRRP